MVAPSVAQLMVTSVPSATAPAAGLNVGAATTSLPDAEVTFTGMICSLPLWMAIKP